jgi:uncharacterized protein YycO
VIKGPAILLYRGHGLMGAAIRWQTRNRYGHAGLLTPEGTVIESVPWHGPRERPMASGEEADAYAVDGMGEAEWAQAICYARWRVQLGRMSVCGYGS